MERLIKLRKEAGATDFGSLIPKIFILKDTLKLQTTVCVSILSVFSRNFKALKLNDRDLFNP